MTGKGKAKTDQNRTSRPSAKMPAQPRKSAGKSAVPNAVPFQPGQDRRRGKGPKPGSPNAGRPTNALRTMLRESGLSIVVPLLTDCAKGEAMVKVKLPDGTETSTMLSASVQDRLRAADLILKYGVGTQIEVGDDQPERPKTSLFMFGRWIEL